MKRLTPLLLLALLLAAAVLYAQAPAVVSSQPILREETLFQVSSLSALLNANYDGWTSFADLRKRGDFGIGTFNALDGEMTEVDGRVYQVRSDGKVYPVSDAALTPFASTTFFHPLITQLITIPLPDLGTLEKLVDALRPAGLPCAVRITGDFDYVKTRSVPAQAKPYPRLVEVVKTQPTFEFTNVSGVMVGFWLPADFSGLNVPGYHLHFLTADRTGGGHLLEARARRVTVDLEPLRQFELILPEKIEGAPAGNTQEETERVEH
jgi:acetolactate decarboxylase